ncbi:uncharacterized protein AMSG_00824 [Thecamonas trahens ATCC 50062]|uniref:Uncharacterized protein n=1 Tax=Thecamonas trahens ATCC 50062 TaxID=461836 RepID=A0A0L0DED9_THETB|nr:hypothetical protein AMSG_00824 [Thecamonas trahens ATCC 50062]KNC50664.1 hypothetical protein AMSG_00824 [Thecamonas trahens ATCC 50062]|eukprot:XP_013762544.1 hypothetical protein AMSG_00824 [Thecamonas trahens ATCC 50062]
MSGREASESRSSRRVRSKKEKDKAKGRNYKAEYAEAKKAYDQLKAKYLDLLASVGDGEAKQARSEQAHGDDGANGAERIREGLAARTEALQLKRENAALVARVAALETELAAEASHKAKVLKERDELEVQTRELEASMSASMESVASLSATMRQVAPLVEELEGLKVTHSKLLKSHSKVRRRLEKKQNQLQLLRAELEALDARDAPEAGSPARVKMAAAVAAASAGDAPQAIADELLALPVVAAAIERASMMAKISCTMKSVETEALLLATMDELNELKVQMRQLAELNNELNAENIALLSRITSPRQ